MKEDNPSIDTIAQTIMDYVEWTDRFDTNDCYHIALRIEEALEKEGYIIVFRGDF